MVWFNVFNDQFWVVIAGMVCACAGKSANSRCRSCTFCGPTGILVIERDTAAETAIEMARLERQRAQIEAQTPTQNQEAPILDSPQAMNRD